MKKIISIFAALVLICVSVPLSADSGSDYSCTLMADGNVISSVGTQDILPIGSVSKTFAAALLLRLAEEGAIGLDNPVTDYLHEFYMADERYHKITVRMLLNHSSGLYGSTLKNSMLYGEYDSWNHDNILSLLKDQRLKYEPGTMACYCNDGYSLLELIIEKVTGMDYSAAVRAYVTLPLKLSAAVTAKEYGGSNKDIVSAIASGGMLENSAELALFGTALFDGFLTQESAKEMTEGRFDDDGRFDFGLGLDDVSVYPFDRYGIRAYAKDGDTLMTSASLVILPDYNISAAVIREGSSSVICRTEAIKLIINYLKENKIKDVEFYDMPAPETADKSDISEYKKYEGLYVSNSGQYSFSISRSYGILRDLYRSDETKYAYIGNGNFAYRGEILSFESDVLRKRGTAYINSEDRYLYDYAFAEKKEDGAARSDVWSSRDKKSYFICDEDPRSQILLMSIPKTNVYFAPGVNALLGYMHILDDDTASSDLSLPGTFGRDLTDLHFFREGGTEFVKAQGWTFVDSDSIPYIYDGYESVATIGENGYLKWYKIGNAAGKKMTAESLSGVCTVYDKAGNTCFSTLLNGGECILPEGGFIVFGGLAATRFRITMN